MKDAIRTFLKQSNEIELVYDKKYHKQALKAWEYLIGFDAITPENLLKTHAILMRDLLSEEKLGSLRNHMVYVGYDVPPNPESLQRMMSLWIISANAGKTEEQIKKDHIQFERIHPFSDGNGRIGRILMNWQRVKNGYPILIIWSKYKYDYYKWFVREVSSE